MLVDENKTFLISSPALFVHQQLYIAALLSVSLDIGCKPPIVEVMELSECDGNLSEDGQVEVNTYGSPIAALDRLQDIVRGGEALVVIDENIVRVVSSTNRIFVLF